MVKWVTAFFTKWSRSHVGTGWDVSIFQFYGVSAGTSVEGKAI